MKATCPDEETLTDYLEGRLSEKERSQVETHLSECETCLEEIVVANGLAQGRDRFELDPVPNEVTEAAVRLVVSGPEGVLGGFDTGVRRLQRRLEHRQRRGHDLVTHAISRDDSNPIRLRHVNLSFAYAPPAPISRTGWRSRADS